VERAVVSNVLHTKINATYSLNLRQECKNAVKDNMGQNTASLLAGYSYGVNKTTCFGLIGGHHQVYKMLAIGD